MERTANWLDAGLGLSLKADQLGATQVCLRALAVYLVLIEYVRLGKKRFLGEATAFDATLVIVAGSLASRGISGNAPFIASLAATGTLIFLHWVLSYYTEDLPTLSYLAMTPCSLEMAAWTAKHFAAHTCQKMTLLRI